MASPKSPIGALVDSLAQMPALKGFVKTMLAGKNSLAVERSTPSIVLFPVEAGYQAPHDVLSSVVDIDIKIAAHLWGANLDEAWDLRERYVAALRQHAIGNPGNPWVALDAQAGIFFAFLTEAWDVSTDTGQQGQELEVTIAARLSAGSTTLLGTGLVEATSLHGVQTTLDGSLAAGSTTATVLSTDGFASTGNLSIDREQLAYTGKTATTFTGLSRGLNGTTPAPHAPDAPVTQ